MCQRFHPIHCIVPPYMLRQIAENGTTLQQAHARQNLASSWQLRSQRAVATAMAGQVDIVREVGEGGKDRTVYDARNGSILPGTEVRTEGEPPVDDVSVNEAYDGAGVTYDLFYETYGRDSVDGMGMPIVSTVHYRIGYDNAFWNGQQMVYGDGDEDLPEAQRLFNRFTISVDVIAHELTHGVTQFETSMIYRDQPGALNESISDVFGALVRQFQLQQTARDADWLIGVGLFTPNVNGIAIRSLKEPGSAYNDPILGRDPQPGHMRDYVHTLEDNGGVHINSGIPNHAFYLTALEIGGYAWEKAGRIWYHALSEKMTSNADFQQTAQFLYESAGELYGSGSLEQKAVVDGWSGVGIEIEETTDPTPPDPGPPDPGNGSPGDGSSPGCLDTFLSQTFWRRLFGGN